MKTRGWLALAVVLSASAATVRADSSPIIAGSVRMIELCPQSICGAAIFIGTFQGRVGINPRAIGTVTVAVNHDDLPVPGACARITRGVWQLQTLARGFAGVAGGQLCATSTLTFHVDVGMILTSGGTGTVGFSGLLDHRPFPPTLAGEIF